MVLFKESNPVPVKYALSQMGLMRPVVRLPLVELSLGSKAQIDLVLAQLREEYSGYLINHAHVFDRAPGRAIHIPRAAP